MRPASRSAGSRGSSPSPPSRSVSASARRSRACCSRRSATCRSSSSVMFALADGEVVVAQFSIIGSIFANALLVLGLVIVVGARAATTAMRFRARLPMDTATLLLVGDASSSCSSGSRASHDPASRHVRTISAIAAALPAGRLRPGWSATCAARAPARPSEQPRRRPLAARRIGRLLAVAGVGAAFVSDWFVAALRPTIDAGRRVGSSSPASSWWRSPAMRSRTWPASCWPHKGQADLAISVVKNSVAQIAAFLFPALVLVSLLFTHHLTFDIAPRLHRRAAAHGDRRVAGHGRRGGDRRSRAAR